MAELWILLIALFYYVGIILVVIVIPLFLWRMMRAQESIAISLRRIEILLEEHRLEESRQDWPAPH